LKRKLRFAALSTASNPCVYWAPVPYTQKKALQAKFSGEKDKNNSWKIRKTNTRVWNFCI